MNVFLIDAKGGFNWIRETFNLPLPALALRLDDWMFDVVHDYEVSLLLTFQQQKDFTQGQNRPHRFLQYLQNKEIHPLRLAFVKFVRKTPGLADLLESQ